MKKIINGRIYDTHKAVLVGEYDYGSRGDFTWWTAGLYKTPRSGYFFLAGAGGPMTVFSKKNSDNTWSGGEKLFPMNVEEAFVFAKKYLEPEVIKQHFAVKENLK